MRLLFIQLFALVTTFTLGQVQPKEEWWPEGGAISIDPNQSSGNRWHRFRYGRLCKFHQRYWCKYHTDQCRRHCC